MRPRFTGEHRFAWDSWRARLTAAAPFTIAGRGASARGSWKAHRARRQRAERRDASERRPRRARVCGGSAQTRSALDGPHDACQPTASASRCCRRQLSQSQPRLPHRPPGTPIPSATRLLTTLRSHDQNSSPRAADEPVAATSRCTACADGADFLILMCDALGPPRPSARWHSYFVVLRLAPDRAGDRSTAATGACAPPVRHPRHRAAAGARTRQLLSRCGQVHALLGCEVGSGCRRGASRRSPSFSWQGCAIALLGQSCATASGLAGLAGVIRLLPLAATAETEAPLGQRAATPIFSPAGRSGTMVPMARGLTALRRRSCRCRPRKVQWHDWPDGALGMCPWKEVAGAGTNGCCAPRPWSRARWFAAASFAETALLPPPAFCPGSCEDIGRDRPGARHQSSGVEAVSGTRHGAAHSPVVASCA